jgi:hypothetical protein
MNRARDYTNFIVKFVGVGYIVLWPLSVTNTNGDVFGAAFVCGGRLGAALDALCRLPHPFHLSLGLHFVGALFAALALLHLAALVLMRALPTRRQPQAAAAPSALVPVAVVRPKKARFHLRSLPPPRKYGRPRKEFGLRGVPR